MNKEPKNIDVLQNLEFAVVNLWRKHPDMTNYVVARAYEAAFEHYRAEARGHQPKACKLTGLDHEVFEAVKDMCEWRLGRSSEGKPQDDQTRPIPVPELVEGLRQLGKSVEFQTKSSGRQGYLTFVSQFVK